MHVIWVERNENFLRYLIFLPNAYNLFAEEINLIKFDSESAYIFRGKKRVESVTFYMGRDKC